MAAVKVFPEEVDRKLAEVFTRHGYDGASMELLSQATGLKKASLYHRFPGGKRDMAAHVLKNIETWFSENIYAVLRDEEMPVSERLDQAMQVFRSLFEDGARNCSLRMLSACSESAYFQATIARCFTILHNGFTLVAIRNGFSEELAKAKAMEVIINIQGSLVLSRAMNDNAIFKTSIAAIPQILSHGEEKK